MSQIIILSVKLYKHEKRTPVDAERDTHGVCTRSTADDCRLAPKIRNAVNYVRACVCACVSFSYYYYVRVRVPAADICPFVSPSPPPCSVAPTWSRSTPSYRRPPRRSCAFDPSHPPVLRKLFPYCTRRDRCTLSSIIIVLLLIRISRRSRTARRRAVRPFSTYVSPPQLSCRRRDTNLSRKLFDPFPTAAMTCERRARHSNTPRV